ncbi:hypothetical protein [Bacillus sp. Au-Bac7]|nr:hypothetical protein [Bacillus sp. Au-Bac7]MCE4051887.1 hypothetical protein [Bacillus sp. Au-Bac7]
MKKIIAIIAIVGVIGAASAVGFKGTEQAAKQHEDTYKAAIQEPKAG